MFRLIQINILLFIRSSRTDILPVLQDMFRLLHKSIYFSSAGRIYYQYSRICSDYYTNQYIQEPRLLNLHFINFFFISLGKNYFQKRFIRYTNSQIQSLGEVISSSYISEAPLLLYIHILSYKPRLLSILWVRLGWDNIWPECYGHYSGF